MTTRGESPSLVQVDEQTVQRWGIGVTSPRRDANLHVPLASYYHARVAMMSFLKALLGMDSPVYRDLYADIMSNTPEAPWEYRLPVKRTTKFKGKKKVTTEWYELSIHPIGEDQI